ncbi:MAG: hypothetical protein ACYC6A_00825 [Armatimonadota bacterium]
MRGWRDIRALGCLAAALLTAGAIIAEYLFWQVEQIIRFFRWLGL